MDFLGLILYFLAGAIDALFSTMSIVMYLYLVCAVSKSYIKNKKIVLTYGIKTATLVIVLCMIIGGFLGVASFLSTPVV